jgi:hypothetical protein
LVGLSFTTTFRGGQPLHPIFPSHTSIVGDSDSVVVPRESAVFPRGDVQVLSGRGHNSLLFDPESIALVVDRVRRVQRSETRAQP